jgi:hypothetical protein
MGAFAYTCRGFLKAAKFVAAVPTPKRGRNAAYGDGLANTLNVNNIIIFFPSFDVAGNDRFMV